MKSNICYLFFLLFLPFFLQAQLDKSSGKLSRFSVELEGGIVSTFMNIGVPYCGECCFGDCVISAPLNTYDRLPSPAVARQSAILINYQLNNRHFIGAGYMIGQYGERQIIANERQTDLIEYNGIKLRYAHQFLHGDKIRVMAMSDINLEFPRPSHLETYAQRGLSAGLNLGASYFILSHIAIKISLMGKVVLTKYAYNAWEGHHHRFGTGLLLGIEYRLGKIKFDSPEKQ